MPGLASKDGTGMKLMSANATRPETTHSLLLVRLIPFPLNALIAIPMGDEPARRFIYPADAADGPPIQILIVFRVT